MNKQNISIDKLADGADIKFTVDAALLSELGERLVGKPYIALGELVKNSYDADANNVSIRFGSDRIEIIDNGYGMDFKEFKSFWMRVGSQHKQQQRYSRNFQRPMTGSKGIGRLAVQFLAKEIGMRTVSDKNPNSEIQVYVNWAKAQKAGDLTEAIAKYRITEPSVEYPNGSKQGTAIILSGLNQSWDTEAITKLAQEIWPLQPPFRSARGGTLQEEAFEVNLDAPNADAVEHFKNQMEAVLDIWDAKLNGRLISASNGGNRRVEIILEFKKPEKKIFYEYDVNDYNLNSVEFEIRVFTLKGKQSSGIIVDEAREYFKNFGGIHVYDAGFHMPFYGTVESDWLRIQYDQASRISKSILLPEEIQVPRGLQFLPTISRIFGVVHVDTAKEKEIAQKVGIKEKGEYLQIQVTRDRLVDNIAYKSLTKVVRTAMDYYAMQEAARQYSEKETQRPTEPAQRKFERVEDILNRHQEDIPRPVYKALSREVKSAVTTIQAEQERITRQAGLLGALATTGMTALAYEHETKKHYFKLYNLMKDISVIKVEDPVIQNQLNDIVQRLTAIIDQSQALRAVFGAMLDEENRTMVKRFKARSLIRDVSYQLGILLHGVRPTTYRVDDELLLPEAAFAEWSAIFQNVLLNAMNAMLEKDEQKIDISSRAEGNRRIILIQDTGVGVNLPTSEELFKPFVRELKISPEWQGLGVGGTGLGLTIVRMIADSIGCNVSFTKPEEGFKTAFQIQWREKI
jgi:signal transduction histidine kinase